MTVFTRIIVSNNLNIFKHAFNRKGIQNIKEMFFKEFSGMIHLWMCLKFYELKRWKEIFGCGNIFGAATKLI